MPVRIDDRGANNQVDAPSGFLETYDAERLLSRGTTTTWVIGRGSNCNGMSILCRSHGTIHVGDHVRLVDPPCLPAGRLEADRGRAHRLRGRRLHRRA